MADGKTGTVADYSDDELLKRAVHNARAKSIKRKTIRWAHITEVFGLGSTYAIQLCRRFGLDPDELC